MAAMVPDAFDVAGAARTVGLVLSEDLAAEAAAVLARLSTYATEVLEAAGAAPGEPRSATLPLLRARPLVAPPPASPAPSPEAALKRIAARSDLNLVTDLFPERAKARRAGPLAGVPFLAKDLFDVEGYPTRAGGRAWLPLPATRDAETIATLERAGAVLIGRTGMDEYAYGFSGENLHDGDVLNPHDLDRLAGGSSSGSAAAVAAGVVPLALGSDTNGSVRVPAALCGVWGFKPSFGRVSRRGMFPFVDSLDHPGLFADCLDRLEAGWTAFSGQSLGVDAAEPRVAVLAGHFAQADDPDVLAAMDAARVLAPRGLLDLPLAAVARSAAFLITAAEGGALHAPVLRDRPDAFGSLVGPRLAAGAILPARWLLAAQAVRRAWTDQLLSAFAEADVLLAPATPFPAPLRREQEARVAGCTQDARLALGLFTQPLTLAGVPVLVAPHRRTGRMPCGVQLIAAPGREAVLFAAARRLERAGFVAALAGEVPHAA
jgi:aspartyl-tRNA(Asn)/glutamyl-tRNA(Gln) amidotransferase subunit A